MLTGFLGTVALFLGIKPKKYYELVFPSIPGLCKEQRVKFKTPFKDWIKCDDMWAAQPMTAPIPDGIFKYEYKPVDIVGGRNV